MRAFQLRQITALLASLLLTGTVIAKPVNLYDQPKADAKVLGTIESSSNMVPIFSSKDGTWMKVGDPQNGNVGWIKMSDVASTTNGGMTSSGFSMTEKTVNTDKGPQTYRTIQFGNPQPANSAEAAKTAAAIQKQQAQIERDTIKAIQNIFNNANAFYQANPDLFKSMNMPIVVPVMVVPAAVATPAPAPTPAPAKTTAGKS